MADLLPQNFPLPSENILASYDFTDILSGTGFVRYWLCAAGTSGGMQRFLTPIQLIGYGDSTHAIPDDAVEYDLDLSANNFPRTLRGKGYFSFYIVKNTAVAGHAVTFQLRKWDGSSETNISSSVTSENAPATAGTIPMLVEFDVPETGIKKGENIRLSLSIANSSGTGEIYLNPSSATPSSLYLPYKIEQ